MRSRVFSGVMSPPPNLCNGGKVCTLGVLLRGELGFLTSACVLQISILRSSNLFNSAYVDLKYIESSLTFTVVCLCGVCSHVVVLDLSVRLSLYHMRLR